VVSLSNHEPLSLVSLRLRAIQRAASAAADAAAMAIRDRPGRPAAMYNSAL